MRDKGRILYPFRTPVDWLDFLGEQATSGSLVPMAGILFVRVLDNLQSKGRVPSKVGCLNLKTALGFSELGCVVFLSMSIGAWIARDIWSKQDRWSRILPVAYHNDTATARLVNTTIFALTAYHAMDALDRIRTRLKGSSMLCPLPIPEEDWFALLFRWSRYLWYGSLAGLLFLGPVCDFVVERMVMIPCVREWWRPCIEKSVGDIVRLNQGGDMMADSPCVTGAELS
jgi:hypothetical protein